MKQTVISMVGDLAGVQQVLCKRLVFVRKILCSSKDLTIILISQLEK